VELDEDWRETEGKDPRRQEEMKKLIVNADDLGVSEGVNRGIAEGMANGVITSATLMANGGAFEAAVRVARANPRAGVGCHLVLIGGKAVSDLGKAKRLEDENGNLPENWGRLLLKLGRSRRIVEDIANEMRAQVEKIRMAGIEPTHLDTHKHTHCHPRVMEALGQVAEETGIRKVRRPFEEIGETLGSGGDGGWMLGQRASALASLGGLKAFGAEVKKRGMITPDQFYGVTRTGRLTAEAVIRVMEGMRDGTSELMCHPGYCDEELRATRTWLAKERERELAALMDVRVKETAKKIGIELVTYRELN